MTRLRRWVWGLLALSTVAMAQPDPSLQFQTQVLVRGATTTELVAQLPDTPARAAGSLLAWQFELPLALQAATLRSPGGIETPLDLAVVRAATRHQRGGRRLTVARVPARARARPLDADAAARAGAWRRAHRGHRQRAAAFCLAPGAGGRAPLDGQRVGADARCVRLWRADGVPMAGLAPRVRWRAPDGQGGEAGMVESPALPRAQRITEQPGRYGMVLRLQGTEGEFQVQSGVDMAGPGPPTLSLRMAADDARRLPAQPLTQAVRLHVTHFTAGRADLAQRLRGVPLPQPLERARFCRWALPNAFSPCCASLPRCR